MVRWQYSIFSPIQHFTRCGQCSSRQWILITVKLSSPNACMCTVFSIYSILLEISSHSILSEEYYSTSTTSTLLKTTKVCFRKKRQQRQKHLLINRKNVKVKPTRHVFFVFPLFWTKVQINFIKWRSVITSITTTVWLWVSVSVYHSVNHLCRFFFSPMTCTLSSCFGLVWNRRNIST